MSTLTAILLIIVGLVIALCGFALLFAPSLDECDRLEERDIHRPRSTT